MIRNVLRRRLSLGQMMFAGAIWIGMDAIGLYYRSTYAAMSMHGDVETVAWMIVATILFGERSPEK